MTREKMTYQSRQGGTHRFIKVLAFSALLATSALRAPTIFVSPINVSTSTQTELESNKGTSPSKAKTIIVERLDRGNFQAANDLQKRVRGIGMRPVEKMVDNGLTIKASGPFNEPNGVTKKDGSGSSRRSSCPYVDSEG